MTCSVHTHIWFLDRGTRIRSSNSANQQVCFYIELNQAIPPNWIYLSTDTLKEGKFSGLAAHSLLLRLACLLAMSHITVPVVGCIAASASLSLHSFTWMLEYCHPRHSSLWPPRLLVVATLCQTGLALSRTRKEQVRKAPIHVYPLHPVFSRAQQMCHAELAWIVREFDFLI